MSEIAERRTLTSSITQHTAAANVEEKKEPIPRGCPAVGTACNPPHTCCGARGSMAPHLPQGLNARQVPSASPQTSLSPHSVQRIQTPDKMTKKTAIPDEIAQALAMREVGYTVLSISQRLGLSVRSLQRHFAAHGAVKGGLKQELMDGARAELMKRVTSDDTIRDEVAQLVNDDLAHTRHLRGILHRASEHLHASSLTEAVLVMRAVAAYSTAIKNTSDTLRQTMRVERAVVVSEAALPELVVREMTRHEVEALRAGQEEQAA